MSATPRDPGRPLLRVEGLVTAFDTEGGVVRAVDGVDLTVEAGRTLGLVGESGCGKSVTALSIVGLLPRPAARIEAGRILLDGTDLARADEATLHRIRGRHIGMVFQEPMTALNPVQRIGRQVGEALRLHRGLDARAALARAVELLRGVGIPDPELRVSEYPHQLSGGMRQRAMIATALACGPDLLIADEPTTALDVTVQAQVLDLLRKLRRERSMGLLLITHDLGVIAENCDEVLVMYAGRVAERASVTELFARPRHPYTRGLLASMPRLETPRKTRLPVIEGTVPSLAAMPEGCRFAGRCPWRTERCTREVPALRAIAPNRAVACHHAEAIAEEAWR